MKMYVVGTNYSRWNDESDEYPQHMFLCINKKNINLSVKALYRELY